MCVAPTFVYPGNKPTVERVPSACGKCWACLKNRVNDLIGKTAMEYSTSEWAYALTLTYDDKKLATRSTAAQRNAARHIYKDDFQNFIRALKVTQQRDHEKARRNDVPSTRYLVAGEYGSTKGRAHFHAIIMGCGIAPKIPPLRTPYKTMDLWPWGFVFADNVGSDKTIRYVAKYLVKEQGAKALNRDKPKGVEETWVSYSKYPPLGTEAFQHLAVAQAEAQIMPQDMRYKPPLQTNPNDRYSMTLAQERLFWETLIDHWPAARLMPCTDWVYNSRLRYIKWAQNKRWDSLPPSEMSKILLDSLQLRHRQNVYIQPMDDSEVPQLWLSDLQDEIRTNEFLSEDHKRLALRLCEHLRVSASAEWDAAAINLLLTHFPRNPFL